MRTHKAALWVGIAAIIVVVALLMSKKTPKTLENHENIITVTAMTVSRQEYAPYLELLGIVRSVEESQLSIPVAAFVQRVLVKAGQTVTKGQLLLEFDSAQIKYQLVAQNAEVKRLEAEILTEELRAHHESQEFRAEKALLVLKEKEYSREKRLLKQRASSQAGLDRSQEKVVSQKIKVGKLEFKVKNYKFRLQALTERLNAAKAKQAELADDLQRLEVRAPFNAIVSERWVATGERVSAGAKLLSLYDKERMEIVAKLPERYDALFQAALAKKEKIVATVKKSLHSEFNLERISAQIHSGEVGQRVYFASKRDTTNLIQNEHVHLEVILPKVLAIAVPAAAVYRQDNIYLVDKNNRLVLTKVERLGQWKSNQGQRYLLVNAAGISDDSHILTQHLPNARQGLKVKMIL
ncbi:efflux RND transporter periplasmic adaptor subunit [Piscirickettsia litoralis]|uniref:efflux RND transporter periplasmic adaptor subunit n=1 Tax=Piscirickettsia litoralis TaxID=1891921 RepID=UPI001112EAAF|nr:HlyD family efflux transporter periplasmic adaptor subunit [Piscirickettsia litoralis]